MNIQSLEKRLEVLDLVTEKKVDVQELVDIFMTVADDYTMDEVLDILRKE